MNVVIDTNVIVSGILRPFSPSGDVVRMIATGDIVLCLDGRLLAEYSEVLRRPRFMFDPELVSALLDLIERDGAFASSTPLAAELPDADDRPFIEVAIAADAQCLVTGNRKHFPAEACRGIRVMAPKQFVDYYRNHTPKPSKRRPGLNNA